MKRQYMSKCFRKFVWKRYCISNAEKQPLSEDREGRTAWSGADAEKWKMPGAAGHCALQGGAVRSDPSSSEL